ncbi:hypothetical protein NLG97_g9454 [Lecanicillium saksenae]|uniref:Uncharacterized protein n=1 Tax=Lecanicillium saksenae TaxID=468837 RepID=A0ACC1QFY2_9HYPO|nr:hypothetical protein NLG97_g9454 [Lecanicillium saksenae]
MSAEDIYSHVNQRYGQAAHITDDTNAATVAKAFGYSEADLANIPKDANLGLSCGNPLALTTLQPGETVLDLGSGAGLDVFLASSKVGPSGKAIGVDMNEAMLAKARKLKQDTGKTNVEFVHARITDIPLPAASVDCITSNCVINLVPEQEKQAVFCEIARLLKPGGRVAISDILANRPLPDEIRSRIDLYVGCVAGASQVAEYQTYLETAGFKDILITDAQGDLNVYLGTGVDSCCDAGAQAERQGGCCGKGSGEASAQDLDLNDWVGSYKIFAVKQA